MNRRFFVVLLTVCLFTGAVAIGVHLWHKDALAADLHTLRLMDGLNGVEGVTVEIQVWTGAVWDSHTDDTDPAGKISYLETPHSTATFWRWDVRGGAEWNGATGGDVDYPILYHEEQE